MVAGNPVAASGSRQPATIPHPLYQRPARYRYLCPGRLAQRAPSSRGRKFAHLACCRSAVHPHRRLSCL